jgi:hypothetical protein
MWRRRTTNEELTAIHTNGGEFREIHTGIELKLAGSKEQHQSSNG